MDIYKLEIFDKDGVLLGEIPLDHLASRMRIQKRLHFHSGYGERTLLSISNHRKIKRIRVQTKSFLGGKK